MKTRNTLMIGLLTAVLLLGTAAATLAGHGHHERPEKKGILLVAFGSTVPEAWPAFTNVEEEVGKAFPGVPIRWAYTSRIVRHRLAGKGKVVDSLEMALARMMDEGFTHVAVQSLHTIGGWEFHDLVRNARAFDGMAGGLRQAGGGRPPPERNRGHHQDRGLADSAASRIPEKG